MTKVKLKWVPNIVKIKYPFNEIQNESNRGMGCPNSSVFPETKEIEKYDIISCAMVFYDNIPHSWVQAGLELMLQKMEHKLIFYNVLMSKLVFYLQRTPCEGEACEGKDGYILFMHTYVPKASKIIRFERKKCPTCQKDFEVIITIGIPKAREYCSGKCRRMRNLGRKGKK